MVRPPLLLRQKATRHERDAADTALPKEYSQSTFCEWVCGQLRRVRGEWTYQLLTFEPRSLLGNGARVSSNTKRLGQISLTRQTRRGMQAGGATVRTANCWRLRRNCILSRAGVRRRRGSGRCRSWGSPRPGRRGLGPLRSSTSARRCCTTKPPFVTHRVDLQKTF